MSKKTLLIIAVLLVPTLAQAAVVDLTTVGLLQSSINTALDSIFKSLTGICVSWLGGFILLQMVFTQGSCLIKGGDLEAAWAKFLGGIFWAGICVYIFSNGADFIKNMSNYLLDMAAGLTGEPFDPSYPLQIGINSAVGLLNALDKDHSIFASLNPFPSIMMGLVSVIILASCVVVSFRIFMIIVETKIVIALSPISFALMGLNALRDQGFVPLKYIIAMAYRVLVLGAVLVAMSIFSTSLVNVIQNIPPLSDAGVWPPVWAAAIGYSLLGALAWNANAIASQLASGSSSMTTADAGGAGAIGASIGAALGSAGMTAALAGTKPIQGMSEFMKNLAPAGGGDKNAKTGMGTGGLDAAPLKPDAPAPQMSKSDSESAPVSGEAAANTTAESAAANSSPLGGGFPNPLPDQNVRDPERNAARAERQAAAAKTKAGNESTASIGGGQAQGGKGMLDHLQDAHREARNTQTHAVQISMNTHHDL